MTETTILAELSDTDPYAWPNALENAFGHWEDLLADPDELEARAADLRTGNEFDTPRTRSCVSGVAGITLQDLIGRLDELLSDPDRLEARAAAMRTAAAATEVDEQKWGIDGAAFMRGENPLPDITGPCWVCGGLAPA
jgi:hypothetical protein